MRLNIPTLLTLFRVVLIPFFVLAFYLPFVWAPFACALIFFVAAVTDWFDGYLARRWNQSTRFGAFLDPVADKVMVAIAMVLVVEHYHSWWVTLPAATMIAREIIISALREWMAELGKRSSVAVSWIGKVKNHRADGRAGVDAVASERVGRVGRYWPVYGCCSADALVNVAIFERGSRRFA
ncbi:CDP-diacylglycerol--glycerol-3-phosphate 3-phosphatidyltransferase [Leclercia adecarboxylata]|uniref:CDP-diacylglycerol--glycerol-3-phosphate 3-phosphatidyltransferase n=1 Tax=Leclercia adecarboxylata TaxID=83655 RepID=A0A4V6JJD7_9ENTR|nr:CDP-diacylglycerol--glycerol-3-phosphate 3-phosphatidyltransferase [Leclercia adecarboxylata]